MDNLYRRRLILDLVAHEPVRTQSELCEKLARRGVRVTQATVSRDVEELGIVKTREGYRLPAVQSQPANLPQPALAIVLKEFVREVRQASNMVIIKTHPGNAHSVAVAFDQEAWPEVAGTVAGDDTVFIATKSVRQAGEVRKRLMTLAAA